MEKPTNAFAAVGIGVSDMQKSVDFYTTVLDMKEMQRLSLPHMEEVIVGFEDNIAVALMHYTDGSSQHYKDNPVKLVFYMDDPTASAKRIRQAGLEVTLEPAPIPEFGNLIVGLAKDPDGYVIELLKRAPA